MTPESAIIILLAIDTFLIFIALMLGRRLAKKLDEVLEELRKNN